MRSRKIETLARTVKMEDGATSRLQPRQRLREDGTIARRLCQRPGIAPVRVVLNRGGVRAVDINRGHRENGWRARHAQRDWGSSRPVVVERTKSTRICNPLLQAGWSRLTSGTRLRAAFGNTRASSSRASSSARRRAIGAQHSPSNVRHPRALRHCGPRKSGYYLLTKSGLSMDNPDLKSGESLLPSRGKSGKSRLKVTQKVR